MVKLIKYFNDNYGQQYGNVDYPRTKKEIYQTYQIIKSYGIKDNKLMSLLNEVVLPKPTSIKEREMYSECLYEIGKETLPKLSEFENDLPNADWNQNDETQIDYIKNRPFYEGIEEIIIADEQTIAKNEYGTYCIPFCDTSNIYMNVPFEIIFDGVKYKGITIEGSRGDVSFNFITNDGMSIEVENGNVNCDNLTGTHTIKVSVFVNSIIKLDDKYLSDNVMTKNNIKFNSNGELVVTIGEITKIFVSKDVVESSISSITPTVDESTGILKIGN